MNREGKKALIGEYKDIFSQCKGFVIFDYSKIDANQFSKFRAEIRKVDGGVKVSKNTLVQLALKDTEYDKCSDIFKGSVAFAWGNDEVSPFKIAYNFSKENSELKIVGGGLGNLVFNKKEAIEMAKLPNLEESRAILLRLLMAVPSKLVRLANEPAAGFTRILQQKTNN